MRGGDRTCLQSLHSIMKGEALVTTQLDEPVDHPDQHLLIVLTAEKLIWNHSADNCLDEPRHFPSG